MGTKVERWLADDGTEFADEGAMDAYELDAKEALDVWRWIMSTPGLSVAAQTRRENTVMAYLRWKRQPSDLPNEPAAEEDPEADQGLAAAA